jgi:hypothetical protein
MGDNEMGVGAIAPIIGGVGSILGIFGQQQQSSNDNAAISGLTNSLNQVLGTESGAVNQLMSQYFGTTVPELDQQYKTQTADQQFGLDTAYANQGMAGGAASALQNNPYLAGITGLVQQILQPNQNVSSEVGSANRLGTIAGQLDRWKGLKPQEMAALETQSGNATQSAAQTLEQQMGGVANPALLAQKLQENVSQSSMDTGVQLGAAGAQQELGAREAAGQAVGQQAGIYGSAASEQLAQLQSALQGTTAAGQQYLSGNEAAGQIYGQAAGQDFGMSADALQSIMQGLGLQSQTLGQGLGALSNIGSTYENLLGSVMNSSAQQQANNPLASLFGSLGGDVSSIFGGSNYGGYTAPAGYGESSTTLT